jgi:protein TIF31
LLSSRRNYYIVPSPDGHRNLIAQNYFISHKAQEEDAIMSSTFELVLLIPTQDFVALPRANNAQANSEGYLELPLPSQPTEAVHDLKSIITESPEGFWLGSFGLKPVIAEEIVGQLSADDQQGDATAESVKQWGAWKDLEPPVAAAGQQIDEASIWRLTTEGVLGEYADLSAVFSGEFEGRRRGLKVVPSESTMV